jgi:hypothetical protein
MNSSIRWRVMLLQGLVIVVLAGVAAFAYGAGTFSHNQISQQLTNQKITFPAADSAAIKALPAADASAMNQYAGRQLTDGLQAETYANHFLGVHLTEIAGGLTYSEASAKAIAAPNDAKLAGQVATLSKGETLKGLLLNAYGWWTIGTYALYAAIGFAIAAFAVVVAFAFELVEALQSRKVTVKSASRSVAPASA